uniref:Uncharacterized protein n=1 Tax=Rhizophora mucronata TaxID=61149 RepID=A0A2P2N5J0_RHIMU
MCESLVLMTLLINMPVVMD